MHSEMILGDSVQIASPKSLVSKSLFSPGALKERLSSLKVSSPKVSSPKVSSPKEPTVCAVPSKVISPSVPARVEPYSTVVLAPGASYLDGVAAVHAAIQTSVQQDYPGALGSTSSALKSPRCSVGAGQFLVTFKAGHPSLAEPGFGDTALSVAVNLFPGGVVEFQRRYGCSCLFNAFYQNVLGALKVKHTPLWLHTK